MSVIAHENFTETEDYSLLAGLLQQSPKCQKKSNYYIIYFNLQYPNKRKKITSLNTNYKTSEKLSIMLIDFKEIPKANTGNGNQDTFELFARDFLEVIGYEVVEEPARGADSGKDLIVLEKRPGVSGESILQWLVSCKHFAHNQKGKKGKSVTPDDEQNILDRVISKNCDGFIGFYSTIPSEGLMNKLRGLSSQIGFQVFDSEKIEKYIIGQFNREHLFLRYFPNSFKLWKQLYYYTEPVKLFSNYFNGIEYSIEQALFKHLFEEPADMIKPLRNNSSLASFLKSENIQLLVHDLAWEIFWIDFSNTKYGKFNLKELQEKIIPDILSEQNVIINPTIGKSFSFEIEKKCAFFIYPNHLLINPEAYKKAEQLFNELQEILQ